MRNIDSQGMLSTAIPRNLLPDLIVLFPFLVVLPAPRPFQIELLHHFPLQLQQKVRDFAILLPGHGTDAGRPGSSI